MGNVTNRDRKTLHRLRPRLSSRRIPIALARRIIVELRRVVSHEKHTHPGREKEGEQRASSPTPDLAVYRIARFAPRGTPAGFRVYKPLAPGPWFNSVSKPEYERRYFAQLAYELVINLRTARSLCLKIPQPVLLGADDAIQ